LDVRRALCKENALSDPADARITRVADAIRAYLSRHPDAADSEEGIAAWWMPAMDVDTCTAEVAAALERLYAQGLIERHSLPDGRVIYRGPLRNGRTGGGS
jgi:hypothetical protein